MFTNKYKFYLQFSCRTEDTVFKYREPTAESKIQIKNPIFVCLIICLQPYRTTNSAVQSDFWYSISIWLVSHHYHNPKLLEFLQYSLFCLPLQSISPISIYTTEENRKKFFIKLLLSNRIKTLQSMLRRKSIFFTIFFYFTLRNF